jgi:hypothetical protein
LWFQESSIGHYIIILHATLQDSGKTQLVFIILDQPYFFIMRAVQKANWISLAGVVFERDIENILAEKQYSPPLSSLGVAILFRGAGPSFTFFSVKICFLLG